MSMTPERLLEIEKLAAEAPLGEWPEDELWGGEDGFCAQGPYHNCPHGGHTTQRGVDACNEVLFAHAVADQRFMQKATEYALPLVKALREAWSSLEWQAAMTKALSESQERLVQEVKEARAEVKRLRDLIDTVIRNCMECYDKRECQSCAWLREGTEKKR